MPQTFNNRFVKQMARESIAFREYVKSHGIELIREWDDDATSKLFEAFDSDSRSYHGFTLGRLWLNSKALIEERICTA